MDLVLWWKALEEGECRSEILCCQFDGLQMFEALCGHGGAGAQGWIVQGRQIQQHQTLEMGQGGERSRTCHGARRQGGYFEVRKPCPGTRGQVIIEESRVVASHEFQFLNLEKMLGEGFDRECVQRDALSDGKFESRRRWTDERTHESGRV